MKALGPSIKKCMNHSFLSRNTRQYPLKFELLILYKQHICLLNKLAVCLEEVSLITDHPLSNNVAIIVTLHYCCNDCVEIMSVKRLQP